MLKQFVGINSVPFEKARLIITMNNKLGPDEKNIQIIMNAFQGKDSKTTAENAFKTIIQKMENSDKKNKWSYQMKNLYILDRIVEQRIFLQKISSIEINGIKKFSDLKKKYSNIIIFERHSSIITYKKYIKQLKQIFKKDLKKIINTDKNIQQNPLNKLISSNYYVLIYYLIK